MLKGIISLIGLILLLVSIANATIVQEVVPERSALSPVFYIFVFVIISMVGLVIFFIKRLDYKLNQVLRSLWISLLITLGIQILLAIIASIFGIYDCDLGKCPSPFEQALRFTAYTLPIIFLIVILVYYIIKFIKR